MALVTDSVMLVIGLNIFTKDSITPLNPVIPFHIVNTPAIPTPPFIIESHGIALKTSPIFPNILDIPLTILLMSKVSFNDVFTIFSLSIIALNPDVKLSAKPCTESKLRLSIKLAAASAAELNISETF